MGEGRGGEGVVMEKGLEGGREEDRNALLPRACLSLWCTCVGPE